MTLMSALVVVFALQVTPPSSGQLAQAYQLYLEGRAFSEDGNLPEAIAKFRESLRVLPSAEVVAELAGVFAQQGDLAQAEAEAERALTTDAKNLTANRLLGLILATRLGRAPAADVPAIGAKAIRHLESAMTAPMRDPVVMLSLGELYLAVGDYPKSIYTLQQFLIDRPGYPQATMLLAQAYRQSGQAEAAQAVIDGFDRDTGDSAAGLARTAAGFEARRDWARAADTWSKVIAADPRDMQARLRYAAALVNSGDLERGRAELASLTRDDPQDGLAWDLLAQAELAAGRLDAAEEAARMVTSLDPADPRGLIVTAEVRRARRDHRGVIALLADRVAAPRDADLVGGAYREMAQLSSAAQWAVGDRKQAIATLEGARRRLPEDVGVLFALAATYEQAGDLAKAERSFRAVIAADAEHAPALNYLGYMLADRGRKLPEAIAFIERALALDADNASYLDSLGWAYFKQDRAEDAIGPLERAAVGAPKSSLILEHLGEAYAKAGRPADAASAYEQALAGDRDGVNVDALTKKRDRARAAVGRR